MKDRFNELKTLLSSAPFNLNGPALSGVSAVELSKVESTLGCALPVELREWLMVTNSPCVGGGGFVGINSPRKSLDLVATFENYPEWKENGWFPVASDGSGNYYVLVTDLDCHPVAFVDVAECASELTYVVASNLSLFLKRFIEKEAGEGRWPFDKSEVLEQDPALASIRTAPLPWMA